MFFLTRVREREKRGEFCPETEVHGLGSHLRPNRHLLRRRGGLVRSRAGVALASSSPGAPLSEGQASLSPPTDMAVEVSERGGGDHDRVGRIVERRGPEEAWKTRNPDGPSVQKRLRLCGPPLAVQNFSDAEAWASP